MGSFVASMFCLAAIVFFIKLVSKPAKKDSKDSPVAPVVPQSVEAMLEADLPPAMLNNTALTAMLDEDLPPAMLDAVGRGEETVIRSGFEERVTSTGLRWFKSILDLSEVNTEIVPSHQAKGPTGSQATVDRLLALAGVYVGYGPQGRVFAKKTAKCSAHTQAFRMTKRHLKAIQMVRRAI